MVVSTTAVDFDGPVASPTDALIPEGTGVYAPVRLLQSLGNLDAVSLGAPAILSRTHSRVDIQSRKKVEGAHLVEDCC